MNEPKLYVKKSGVVNLCPHCQHPKQRHRRRHVGKLKYEYTCEFTDCSCFWEGLWLGEGESVEKRDSGT